MLACPVLAAVLAAMTAFTPAVGGAAEAGGAQGSTKAPSMEAKLRAGCILVATSNITTPPFARSVVLITNYGPQGALGVILNRPLKLSLGDALPDIKSLRGASQRLFYGGPVSGNVLTLLTESREDLEKADGATRVFGDLFFVANKKIINRALKSENQPSRGFAGYAGWMAGQLENELSRGDWNVEYADHKAIFSSDPERLWEKYQPAGGDDWT